jgi:hypothetical protein
MSLIKALTFTTLLAVEQGFEGKAMSEWPTIMILSRLSATGTNSTDLSKAGGMTDTLLRGRTFARVQ